MLIFRTTFNTTVQALVIILLCCCAAAAAADDQRETIRNTLGMEFVRIPAGSFMMGSPMGELHRDGDEAEHRVTITTPFYLQTSEVTMGQWQSIMGSGFLLRWFGDKTLPATKISWFDTQKFIRKLNARGKGSYRLPTEAEWEYAARSGSTTAYPWGDRINCADAMYAGSYYGDSTCMSQRAAILSRQTEERPAPVKSFIPGDWGLYDMQGNVWEWVQDWYGPYKKGDRVDPRGPSNGTERVIRGGSWFDPGHACRSANRAKAHPASRLHTTGFRLVFIPGR
jgi:formylglycine-generating enzyme required for sulfatase activity